MGRLPSPPTMQLEVSSPLGSRALATASPRSVQLGREPIAEDNQTPPVSEWPVGPLFPQAATSLPDSSWGR